MVNRNNPTTLPRPPVCRVCLSNDELQVAIHGAYARAHNIPVKLRVCLPISIDRNDRSDLPTTICHRCVTKLDEYYDFYCHSLTTQRILNGEEVSFRKYLGRKVDRKLTAAVERRNEREGRGGERNCFGQQQRNNRPEPFASFLDMKQSQRKRKPSSQSKRIHSTYTVPMTVFD